MCSSSKTHIENAHSNIEPSCAPAHTPYPPFLSRPFSIIGRIVYEKHTKGTMSNAAANNNKASVQMPKVVTNNAQKQVGTFNGAAATDHI